MKCKIMYHDSCICELEVEVCLYSCFVRHISVLPGGTSALKSIIPTEFQETEESVCNYLTGYLSNRIPKHLLELSDAEILEKLDLTHHTHQFGRMQPYLFLPAFMEHLNMEDGYLVYPTQIKYLYFVDQDPRFDRVYRIENK